MGAKEIIEKKSLAISKNEQFELVPPEGGWGYIVTFGLSIMFTVTVCIMGSFGIVFGQFLSNIGDETSGTTIVNGLFNTVLCFTGLAANQLLQKISYRKVGIIGAFIYCTGSFSTIFVTNLTQLILTFGVIQGLGFGLMMPAVFTTFNHYFDAKKNVVLSSAQAFSVGITIIIPAVLKFFMDHYGFRGTVALMAAFSFHCFPAMICLQPVKWHLRKKIIYTKNNNVINLENGLEKDDLEIRYIQAKSKEDLTYTKHEYKPMILQRLTKSHHDLRSSFQNLEKSRQTLVSMGNIAMSVTNLNDDFAQKNEQKIGMWKALSKSLDLELFKDPVYINIVLGISLAITSDLTFLSVFPKLLVNMGFDSEKITLMLTIYFTADLICRVLLSVLTAFVNVRNRYIFLAGVMFSALFRIAFVLDSSFFWIATVSAGLGFMRCLVQTPLPLVIAEEYTARFVTAFSLYMVVCGFVALAFGPLTGIAAYVPIIKKRAQYPNT